MGQYRAVLFFFLFFSQFRYAISIEFFDISQLNPSEIGILQFDSRPLKNYWLVAAKWNNDYCQRHNHHFLYYTNDAACHYRDEPLADAWCKVRAMLNANHDYPQIKLFIYLDSDAVIDKDFQHLSLNEMLQKMQSSLSWNPLQKPIIFNQDGPCWYSFCFLLSLFFYLNSLVFINRHLFLSH
jgi:hypothetical protein